MKYIYIDENKVGEDHIQRARECLNKAGVTTKDTEYSRLDLKKASGLDVGTSRVTAIFLGERFAIRDDLVFTVNGKEKNGEEFSFIASTSVPYGKREDVKGCLK